MVLQGVVEMVGERPIEVRRGADPLRVGPEHQQVGVLEGRLGGVGADRRRAADDVVAAGAGAPADQRVVARLVGEPDLARPRWPPGR